MHRFTKEVEEVSKCEKETSHKIYAVCRYQKAMKSTTEKLVLRLQELHSEVNVLRKENKILKNNLHKDQEETATHKSSKKNNDM
jgi:cell division protein FtsB